MSDKSHENPSRSNVVEAVAPVPSLDPLGTLESDGMQALVLQLPTQGQTLVDLCASSGVEADSLDEQAHRMNVDLGSIRSCCLFFTRRMIQGGLGQGSKDEN